MNGRCSRACCWTPFGHSTVRDFLPLASQRCRCHEAPDVLLGPAPTAPPEISNVVPCPRHQQLVKEPDWNRVVQVATSCDHCEVETDG